MKRYVKEIANEFLKVKNYPEDDRNRIERIVSCCERGLCTSIEAVSVIMNIHKEAEEKAWNNKGE